MCKHLVRPQVDRAQPPVPAMRWSAWPLLTRATSAGDFREDLVWAWVLEQSEGRRTHVR